MDTGTPFLKSQSFSRERVTQVIAQDGDALSKELNNLRHPERRQSSLELQMDIFVNSP
jgi:hypothetical protein